VKSLTQKPSDDASKLPRAEQMMVAGKEAFVLANQQLKDEIPRLVEARISYFDPSFEALVKTQLDYYARCYEALLPLQKYFGADNGVWAFSSLFSFPFSLSLFQCVFSMDRVI